MDRYFKLDEWKIIEDGFDPEYKLLAESIMSLGNGHMGLRGNFSEEYSGSSFEGTYIGGVYYPDKTRVGWWKIGYPDYYAKVLNAANFIGINIKINNKKLDLAKHDIIDYKRVLDMKHGCLKRNCIIKLKNTEKKLEISTIRFLSNVDREIAAINYKIKPVNFKAKIEITPYIDGTITNYDANYDQVFWRGLRQNINNNGGYVSLKTKKTDFIVSTAMRCQYNKKALETEYNVYDKYIEEKKFFDVNPKEELEIKKYVAVTTNRDYANDNVVDKSEQRINYAFNKGFDKLYEEHQKSWLQLWEESDIKISGDPAAQQGIRFNIFHLNQTYTGHDPRLNIGPKGFTGEKYGGSTYWDTEAFCFPFYLNTKKNDVARNLLLYRYRHLDKAKENADKLDLKGALYPMVTMNGEECHNEWEITFEEIHRNAAIVYAIYNYTKYTGDKKYLVDYGYEVILEVARFWADRVTYNSRKEKYMILGVTGPNEYENNVNNNWYTNRMAAWCLQYALDTLNYLEDNYKEKFDKIVKEKNLCKSETQIWQDIIEKMYYPYVDSLEVFEQQDGYMNKKLLSTDTLNQEDLPLNQNWSWDKILRSCFIKQADVIQGMYFLSGKYDRETKKRNFDFYEPMTVHESSLSPSVYSIVASDIGYEEKAYELYLRTARLDLENYNNDTEDGLHITSMAGTWMSIVHGFAGLNIREGILSIAPFIPEEWEDYSFKINFRQRIINIKVSEKYVEVELLKGKDFAMYIFDQSYELNMEKRINVSPA
ncbi:MAG: family 65 glycosyl hydrolase domain-containing protein [Halanaerobiales bacterium]